MKLFHVSTLALAFATSTAALASDYSKKASATAPATESAAKTKETAKEIPEACKTKMGVELDKCIADHASAPVKNAAPAVAPVVPAKK